MLTRLLLVVGFLVAFGHDAGRAQPMSRQAVFRQVAAMTALGRQMFFDPSLSTSGRMSCATCHDPAHAFGPPDSRPVRRGGADLRQPGLRAVPSLMYLQVVPQFTEHFFDSDDAADDETEDSAYDGAYHTEEQRAHREAEGSSREAGDEER